MALGCVRGVSWTSLDWSQYPDATRTLHNPYTRIVSTFLSFPLCSREAERTHSSFGKRLLFPETRIWLVGGAADVDVIMVQLDGKASGWTDAGVIH